MPSLTYGAADLLVFVDDTGVGELSASHPVFGLGGCALLGADYDVLKAMWTTLRRDAFELAEDKIFHASEVLRRLTDDQVAKVTDLLGRSQPRKFAQVVTQKSSISGGSEKALMAVIRGISSEVQRLFCSHSLQNVHWVFEHSDRLCRAMFTTSQICYFPAINVQNSIHRNINNDFSFMRKYAKEPGLELADLIIFIVGCYYRDPDPRKITSFRQIMAMFSDPRVGRCAHMNFLDKEVCFNSASGEIINPPAVKIRVRGPRRDTPNGRRIDATPVRIR